MGSEHHPGLRGFDSYELKLGDELRGERASLGKSLLDVQRDLRIRADYLAAIEDADASAFPFAGFAAGYVRAYARYLGLDEDDVYRRFREESGFAGVAPTQSVDPREVLAAARPQVASAPAQTARPAAAAISTRFLAANRAQERRAFAVGLRGLGSVAALGALVIGLGYGGWSLLQDLQRLGFAPLPTAPEVLVAAPELPNPAEGGFAGAPAASPEATPRVSLAAIYAAQEAPPPPAPTPRDGPISSIDPRRAGVFALPAAEPALTAAPSAIAATVASAEPAPEVMIAAADDGAEPPIAQDQGGAPMRGVDVLALEDAWIRVRDGERRTLFTGILGPGERFSLPEGAEEPELRAGNAGAVYILVDGAAFGPLGSGPDVARRVNLLPDAVRAAFPLAPHVAASPRPAAATVEEAAESAPGAVALRSE